MNDPTFTPPIISLIDQLTAIVKLFDQDDSNDNASITDSSVSCDSNHDKKRHSEDMLSSALLQTQNDEKGMQMKQLEIAEILQLTEKVSGSVAAIGKAMDLNIGLSRRHR